jgi:hypothetical protein
MSDPRDQEVSPKTRTARQRAREEQQQRLEKALEEVQKLGQQKLSFAKKARKVSIRDPEARFMKQSDGGLAPSYNVQISADATQGIIVGVEVTLEASDSAQRLPALERIEQRLKQRPQQIVADGGYTTGTAIQPMAERRVDFLGNLGTAPSQITVSIS